MGAVRPARERPRRATPVPSARRQVPGGPRRWGRLLAAAVTVILVAALVPRALADEGGMPASAPLGDGTFTESLIEEPPTVAESPERVATLVEADTGGDRVAGATPVAPDQGGGDTQGRGPDAAPGEDAAWPASAPVVAEERPGGQPPGDQEREAAIGDQLVQAQKGMPDAQRLITQTGEQQAQLEASKEARLAGEDGLEDTDASRIGAPLDTGQECGVAGGCPDGLETAAGEAAGAVAGGGSSGGWVRRTLARWAELQALGRQPQPPQESQESQEAALPPQRRPRQVARDINQVEGRLQMAQDHIRPLPDIVRDQRIIRQAVDDLVWAEWPEDAQTEQLRENLTARAVTADRVLSAEAGEPGPIIEQVEWRISAAQDLVHQAQELKGRERAHHLDAARWLLDMAVEGIAELESQGTETAGPEYEPHLAELRDGAEAARRLLEGEHPMRMVEATKALTSPTDGQTPQVPGPTGFADQQGEVPDLGGFAEKQATVPGTPGRAALNEKDKELTATPGRNATSAQEVTGGLSSKLKAVMEAAAANSPDAKTTGALAAVGFGLVATIYWLTNMTAAALGVVVPAEVLKAAPGAPASPTPG
jgi:hypothetical protein